MPVDDRLRLPRASMRPRLITAENLIDEIAAAGAAWLQ